MEAVTKGSELPRRRRRVGLNSFVVRYSLAVIMVGLATVGTQAVISINPRSTFALFYAAVTMSAWYGGLGPGLLATFLAVLIGDYFLLQPGHILAPDFSTTVQLVVFILVALLINSLTAARRQVETTLREWAKQWRVTLASIGDAVIATDIRGRITLMNDVAEKLTGWSQAEAISRSLGEIFQIINETTRERTEDPIDKVIREDRVIGLANHTLLLARDGREIPIDDSGAPIRDDEGQVTGVVLVFRDITQRRQAEEVLEQQANALREQAQLLDLAHNSIMVWDQEDKIIFWNRGAAETYGWSAAEALHKNVHELLTTRFPQPLPEINAQLQQEGRWEGELFHIRRDGTTIIVASRWALQRDKLGRPLKTMEINTDITELKRSEQAQRFLAQVGQVLTASLDYEDTLTNVAQLAVPDLADWCLVDVVKPDETLHRLAVAHVDPDKVELAQELQRRYPPGQDLSPEVAHVLRTGRSQIYPAITDELLSANIRKAERLRIIQEQHLTSAMVVPLVARGRTLGVITFVWAESGYHYSPADLVLAEEIARRAALALDNARLYREAQEEIGARKQIEEQLKASLMEKEVLMKEIHHRVKNNLQAVSNLLYLQSAYVKDQEVRDMFRQTQDRIRSIALIHEKLYQTADLAQLNSAEYISSLATHLIHSYQVNPDIIDLKIEADDVRLDVDTAVPMGVIINELISNSLKHAFPLLPDGQIRQAATINISLRREDDNHLLLVISDNGAGMPENIEPSQTESLGLQLVSLLTSYLKGTLELERNGGAIFKIRFPLALDSEDKPKRGGFL